MTERQQERRPRALTCIVCGLRVVWPDGFPSPTSAKCSRCADHPEERL